MSTLSAKAQNIFIDLFQNTIHCRHMLIRDMLSNGRQVNNDDVSVFKSKLHPKDILSDYERHLKKVCDHYPELKKKTKSNIALSLSRCQSFANKLNAGWSSANWSNCVHNNPQSIVDAFNNVPRIFEFNKNPDLLYILKSHLVVIEKGRRIAKRVNNDYADYLELYQIFIHAIVVDIVNIVSIAEEELKGTNVSYLKQKELEMYDTYFSL